MTKKKKNSIHSSVKSADTADLPYRSSSDRRQLRNGLRDVDKRAVGKRRSVVHKVCRRKSRNGDD